MLNWHLLRQWRECVWLFSCNWQVIIVPLILLIINIITNNVGRPNKAFNFSSFYAAFSMCLFLWIFKITLKRSFFLFYPLFFPTVWRQLQENSRKYFSLEELGCYKKKRGARGNTCVVVKLSQAGVPEFAAPIAHLTAVHLRG